MNKPILNWTLLWRGRDAYVQVLHENHERHWVGRYNSDVPEEHTAALAAAEQAYNDVTSTRYHIARTRQLELFVRELAKIMKRRSLDLGGLLRVAEVRQFGWRKDERTRWRILVNRRLVAAARQVVRGVR